MKIICEIAGVRHEYAGEGRWTRTGGLDFESREDGQAAMENARARFTGPIRHSIRFDDATPDAIPEGE